MWGPVANPTARALASWLCTLWGRHEVPGGVASCLRVGHLGLGALPHLTTRLLGARGVSLGSRHLAQCARSCKLALPAVVAARVRPGGGHLPASGASWIGHSPTPNRFSPWRASGARYALAVGAWGPVTNPKARALRAGFARCGGDTRAPGGGASLAWM